MTLDWEPRSAINFALWPLRRFQKHHDELSIQRQRTIATLTFAANVLLVVLSAVAIKAWQWHLVIRPPVLIFGGVTWGLSLIFITAASSLPRAVTNFVRSLGTRPVLDATEPYMLAHARKFLFYPGMFLNAMAVCILVEESGGVIRSPFTPVLFSMVLAAQQLGRFRTNSKIFIGFGILATGLLFLYERIYGIHPVPHPPDQLSFSFLASSFLVAAIFTHTDKAKNYRAQKGFPPPSHVQIYQERQDVWRYAFYCPTARLDPVLTIDPQANKLRDVQDNIQLRLDELAPEIGRLRGTIHWLDSASDDDAIGQIRYNGTSDESL